MPQLGEILVGSVEIRSIALRTTSQRHLLAVLLGHSLVHRQEFRHVGSENHVGDDRQTLPLRIAARTKTRARSRHYHEVRREIVIDHLGTFVCSS